MPESAIEVRGLTKSYGSFTAVAGIDLRVEPGEVFAILGPNGAGKTTTVEILEGYRRRDGGQVSVLGVDPGTDRKLLKPRVGIVLQKTGVSPYLTVAETITMYAGYYAHPRPVGEIIELVGLAEKRNVRVARLSGGQQRRLDVAVALAGDPELLFLDEPTTGFDPAARREFWDVIKSLAALGKTVLLTTHYMDEAQHLADRLAVVARGRVVAEGTPSTLGDRASSRATVTYRLPRDVEPPPGYARDGEFVSAQPEDLVTAVHDLTGWALHRGVQLEDLQVLRPSLEDVYLRLTADAGEEARS
ncbi:MAG: ABC transporter ATP-binding protein [Jatrophihabitantaceae bacterium]